MKYIMSGQKINLALLARVVSLKKQGLSNVEIGRVIRKDEKQVRRYLSYDKQASDTIPNRALAPSDTSA